MLEFLLVYIDLLINGCEQMLGGPEALMIATGRSKRSKR
jgi:hypothetical protein